MDVLVELLAELVLIFFLPLILIISGIIFFPIELFLVEPILITKYLFKKEKRKRVFLYGTRKCFVLGTKKERLNLK